MDLIAVTLNDGNDFNNHKKLYEYGFNNYKMVKVFDKDSIANKKYYAEDDYFYPLTKNEEKLINIKYKINKRSCYAYIYLNSKLIHKEPLYKK